MDQDTHRKLQAAAQLAVEVREHAAEVGRRTAKIGNAARGLYDIVLDLLGVEGEIHPIVPYLVIENGKARPASEADVAQLRQEWDGEFLLDQPRRELRVKTGKKAKRLHLGHGGLGYGLEKVLLKGMGRPGQRFGQRSFEDALGYSDIGSVETLSKYVWEIRKAIADSARKSRYLQTVEVDRGLSPTGRGYEFNPRWRYLVIRRMDQSSKRPVYSERTPVQE